jgi:hypothetical protein
MGQKQIKKPGQNQEQTSEESKPKKIETEETLKKSKDFLEKLDDRLPKKEERQKILKRKQQSGQ